MVDKITKYLRKLKAKEFEAFLLLHQQLQQDFLKVPGVRKLAGHKNLYRIRLGQHRIVFRDTKEGIVVLRVAKRDDRTYGNL